MPLQNINSHEQRLRLASLLFISIVLLAVVVFYVQPSIADSLLAMIRVQLPELLLDDSGNQGGCC